MICPKCGSSNNDKAKFCSKCGAPLNVKENIAQPQQESFFKQNNILIICIAIIVVVAAVVGVVAFSMSQTPHSTNASDSVSADAPAPTSSSASSTPQSGPLKIISGSFSTGSGESDKTYAKIYVGPQHAGEQVYVQIFYSRDGSSLNNGNMVPVTVDSSGYISVASADAYHFYPDHATIKLYDANQNLKDQKEVYMSPTSGTQTF